MTPGIPRPVSVVVTGASGFIGSHLVDALLSQGYWVVAVDRRCPRLEQWAAMNLGDAMLRPSSSFVTADLAEDELDTVVAGADTVFHLAAVPGVRASWGASFNDYVAANVIGTQRLLAACERAQVRRLVYASSSSVYGISSTPSREDDTTNPVSPYGVTKLAGEQLCLAHAYRPDTSLTTVALRYFTVYGPRQRPDMAISRVLYAALSGTPLTLFGNGTQRREFTYIDDVVAGTIAAARIDVPSAVVNIGGGSSATMLEVLQIAREITGNRVPLMPLAPQPGDVPATAADLSLASSLLCYGPTCDLHTGMARQVEWMRSLPPALFRRFGPEDVAAAKEALCSR